MVNYKGSVNEYNVDCSFENRQYTIPGTRYVISIVDQTLFFPMPTQKKKVVWLREITLDDGGNGVCNDIW